MNITYFGHNCFLIEINGIKVLFDPFITQNPISDIKDISSIQCDYILLTHGHGDHCADVLEVLKFNPEAILISNFEVVNWFQNQREIQAIPMNIGGKIKTKFGSIKIVNAIHSSAMPDGSYGGNPLGFIIYTDTKKFYFAGDTALTMDMKLIGEYYGPIDFSIMPIGDHFTMGYEDALIASDFVNTKTVIGAHYDTFEWIKIDHDKAINCFKSANKELILIPLSQSITI